MPINPSLSEPQIRLLLKLHEKPATIHADYRPLHPLLDHDLVRTKHQGQWGSHATYECSPAGTKLAQEIKQRLADLDRACVCGRSWSNKHEPQCPLGRNGFAVGL